ncbi:dTDP-glucose 4,6-dehydratase [candidate division WWE3 bacterium]|uniref:dTDP-glucose 4,6-dehydratase n=1 Tax=candidate division WWE3 bacterium TaxID=2053526 RepID=A0A955RQK4_UNCKA|nr:dTDP-glucose 4,6-dehydratase [candidate division WWE3 bacterium]
MKLFITGGAGFIGYNFLLYWLQHNPEDTLTVYDKLTHVSNKKAIKQLTDEQPNVSLVIADILDYPTLKEAMIGHDLVIHFAAESHVDDSLLDPGLFMRVNGEGSLNVFHAALENKVSRVHYVSTDEVFGEFTGDLFTEKTPITPRNPYSAAKAGAGHMAMAYFNTYGLPVSISNAVNTYGPFQYPNKLIPKFIMNAITDKKLPVYGDGKQTREWLYVEDHCRGIDTIIKNGKPGERYILGSGVIKENIEIVQLILELAHKDETIIEHVEDRLGHDRSYQADSTRLRGLGWEPQVDFDTRFKETFEWYKNNYALWPEFENIHTSSN